MVCSSLEFPKMMEMKNPRLIVLYIVLQLCALASIVTWVSVQTIYAQYEQIGEFIAGSIDVYDAAVHAVSPLSSAAVDARIRELQNTICATAAQIDHWRDAIGTATFANYTCAVPCLPYSKAQNSTGPGGDGRNCAVSADRYFAKDSEVFLPMSRTRTNVGPGNMETTSHELLLTADAVTIDLSYQIDMPVYSWLGTVRFDDMFSGSSSDSFETRLHAHDGSVIHTYKPGERMLFSARELLELAGVPDALDTPHDRAGANRRPGSSGQSPIGRISGVELIVYVQCSGHASTEDAHVNGCSIAVHKTARGWVYERVVSAVPSGSIPDSTYYGLRVKVQGLGKASHVDLATLFARITTIIVIMSVPRRVAMFVATKMLGHLSAIYRGVLFDRFKLKDAFAGMSARLLCFNYAFVELANRHAHLSSDKLRERMTSILRDRGISDPEIRCLCNFAHSAMISLADERRGHTNIISDVRSQMSDLTVDVGLKKEKKETEVTSKQRVIDSEGFSVACTSSEQLRFRAFVKLLDPDRKRWLLERLFTPREIQTVMKEEQRLAMMEEDSCREVPAEGADGLHETSVPPKESAVLSAREDAQADVSSDQVIKVITSRSCKEMTLEEEREVQKALPETVRHLIQEHTHFQTKLEDHRDTVEKHTAMTAAKHVEHHSRLDQLREETARDIAELRRSISELREALERRMPNASQADLAVASSPQLLRRSSSATGRPVPAPPRDAPRGPAPCFAPPVVNLQSLMATLKEASRDLGGPKGHPSMDATQKDLCQRSEKMSSCLRGIAKDFESRPLYPHSDVWIPLEPANTMVGLSVSTRSTTQDDNKPRKSIPAGAVGSVTAVDAAQGIRVDFHDLGCSSTFNWNRLSLSSSSDAPLHERKTFATIQLQLNQVLDDVASWRTEGGA